MRTRGGFSLMGTLTVVMLLSVLMLGFASVFRHTVPRLTSVREQMRATDVQRDLLKAMRRDLAGASALPAEARNVPADEQTLRIQTGEGTVVYRRTDGRVERSLRPAEGKPKRPTSWDLGRGQVRWRVIDRGGPAEGVELRLGLLPGERDALNQPKQSNTVILYTRREARP